MIKIHWLLQSTAAAPGLAEGQAPVGLLNPLELETLAGFRVVRRRRDWLLGRWTAKHLIRQQLLETTGEQRPLPTIHIANAADGAPYAALRPCVPASPPRPLPLSLSISHAGHYSLCALWPDHRAQVGADVERVELRERSFVETFLTESELSFVRRVIPPERDAIVTGVWSAKEAALKALRTGLGADPRQITVHFRATSPNPDRWTPLDLTLDPALLPESRADAAIQAWWRVEQGYVLTLAVLPLSSDISPGLMIKD